MSGVEVPGDVVRRCWSGRCLGVGVLGGGGGSGDVVVA